jgi:hypothetical protein
MFEQEQQKV